jgi:hypothetical protein
MRDPDHSLATRAQRGDRAALADLYNRHRGKFLGFLRRAAGNPELAEEVFQDVWAKVIQVMGSYDPGRAPFRSWLYQVGANAVVDRLRRESYRRALPLDEPLSQGGEAPVDRIPGESLRPVARSPAGGGPATAPAGVHVRGDLKLPGRARGNGQDDGAPGSDGVEADPRERRGGLSWTAVKPAG